MESSYIITFIGDNKTGLVERIARVIEQNQGNWLDSQLSQLGGKFAGLILISLPEGSSSQLELALQELANSGLSVRVTPAGSHTPSNAAANDITLHIIGPDRSGIVREISHALANREVNVIKLDSTVVSAPMSSEKLFRADIEAEIPTATNTDELLDILDEIANEMTLDITMKTKP